MSNEMEDIKKRLAMVEKDVLSIGKTMAGNLCTLQYNLILPSLKGEEIKSYIEYWEKRLDTTWQEIKDSKTVDAALDAMGKFSDEFTDYVKATKVDTADKAMEIAHSFIKKYSPVALPMKAVKEGNIWLVDVDVGALSVKIAKVKVDAKTGDILSYDIPEKK